MSQGEKVSYEVSLHTTLEPIAAIYAETGVRCSVLPASHIACLGTLAMRCDNPPERLVLDLGHVFRHDLGMSSNCLQVRVKRVHGLTAIQEVIEASHQIRMAPNNILCMATDMFEPP